MRDSEFIELVEKGDWHALACIGGVSDRINRARTSQGSLALHLAVLNKDLNMIQELIRLGADVNAHNFHGVSAPYLAARFAGYRKALLFFATLPEVDWSSHPLDDATIATRVVRIHDVECIRCVLPLVPRDHAFATIFGAIHTHRDDASVLDLIIRLGADVNEGTSAGMTPLLYAMSIGSYVCAEYLMNHTGADVFAQMPLSRSTLLDISPMSPPLSIVRALARDGVAFSLDTLKREVRMCRDLHVVHALLRSIPHGSPLMFNAGEIIACASHRHVRTMCHAYVDTPIVICTSQYVSAHDEISVEIIHDMLIRGVTPVRHARCDAGDSLAGTATWRNTPHGSSVVQYRQFDALDHAFQHWSTVVYETHMIPHDDGPLSLIQPSSRDCEFPFSQVPFWHRVNPTDQAMSPRRESELLRLACHAWTPSTHAFIFSRHFRVFVESVMLAALLAPAHLDMPPEMWHTVITFVSRLWFPLAVPSTGMPQSDHRCMREWRASRAISS